MVSSDLSDEDFLESLGISLDEVNVTADADTHASVTGVYAQLRGCRSVPYPPPEDMRAGKQMTLTDAHIESFPHVEFILGEDYDEFCKMFLMQLIGSRFASSRPGQPTSSIQHFLPYS
ncbi:hypothetical protein JCGZ_23038 [Jatropha curcas]|uniref:Uncharacterized protein n=1 Tax=Jatropha curcas TaxID=180498 RepID=A0A067JPQ8_JATCU|nr:hypothetical protein JCGZ_23038 [Jatropha curcas]